jgi:hypothetical protein
MRSLHEKLKSMVEECRALAALFEDREIRSRLLEVAQQLEHWADTTNRNGAERP